MPATVEALIAAGDANALRALLRAEPALVNHWNAKEKTPLHLAAAAGRADLVRVLLEAGADPRAPDGYDYPPITAAAWSGHQDVIALLVEHLEPDGAPAALLLTMLAGRGHRACVELVLARGVPVDLDDGLGQTALLHALRKGHGDVAALLLDRGARADVSVGAANGTPLSLARQHKLQALVERLEALGGSARPRAAPEPTAFPSLASAAERLKGAEAITLAKAKKLLRGLHDFKGDADSLRFFLWDGDHRVRGDLLLDADEVLIVNGALSVTGALVDFFYNEDDTSQLFVLGDLTVRTMVTGSPVTVRGDLTVRDTLYANSFGLDTLTVTGALKADVIIDEGHEFDSGSIAAKRVFAADGQLPSWREVPGARALEADVFEDPQLFQRGFVEPRLLFQKAIEGTPITRPAQPARKPRRRT